MGDGLGRGFWFYRCAQIATALGYSASSIAAVWWILDECQNMSYVTYIIVPPFIPSRFERDINRLKPGIGRENQNVILCSNTTCDNIILGPHIPDRF
ncbi:hypothetical protein SB6412_03378 [Klebsiella pasteurii]|nr:hypothetical protein SB6412_03378 [Klebsiella pasteurii]